MEWQRIHNEIKNRYLSYLFYFSYLILPSVASTIFNMFVCIKVESESYLLADINIICYSSYWYKGVLYASLMIFIYPVGIPMSYLWLLYQVKHDILLKNNHPSFRQGSVKNNNNKKYIDNNDDDDDITKKTISINKIQSDSINCNNNIMMMIIMLIILMMKIIIMIMIMRQMYSMMIIMYVIRL